MQWPKAQVPVLSAKRTFWEKATLMHVQCNRTQLRAKAERLCRHWYDLACLADTDMGRQAMADLDLLKDVIQIKETFLSLELQPLRTLFVRRFALDSR